MEALIILGLIALLVGALIFRAADRKNEEEAARSMRQAARLEEERVHECGAVVLAFANHFGYLARERVSREDLSAWIDSGITPDDLIGRIWQACGEVQGIVLGEHPFGKSGGIPVLLPESLRARHTYVIGKSGSGKTTLLRNLIIQDLCDGRGLAVLAPEAEMLRDELLPFIPVERWSDVVYVDPADTERPVPFNPLHLEEGEDLDLKVDETFTILQRVFEDDGGTGAPRMEQILRQGLYLLMRIPGTTLLDFERLLDRQDDSFRDWAVRQTGDEETERFWRHTYSAYPKDAHLPLVTRLGRFLRPRMVRSLLCAPACLNVRKTMDEGKVLMFNLSDGLLGASNAELIGQLVVAKLQTAAMSRADAPKEDRRPFSVYLDEFQTFCGVASASYEKILSRARKYGLSLVLAHQQTGQIPEHLMRDILGNVATIVAFSVGATDARRITREMIGEVDGEPVSLDYRELLSLRVGEAWCRIGRNVLFMRTYPAPDGGHEWVRDEVVDQSRRSFGVKPQAPLPIQSPPAAKPRHADLPPAMVRESRDEIPSPVPVRETERRHARLRPRPDELALPVAPPSSPGRGGAQHKYLQELLKRWAESREWRATIEERILDGLGSVDVALRKGDHAVACEIAVTTSPEHEVGNIQKCVAAGFGLVILLSPQPKTLSAVRSAAANVLPQSDMERVRFCTPEEAFSVLEGIEADAAETIDTIRGYKVKARYRAVAGEDGAERRQVVSQVIAKALRRLKGGP